MADERPIGVFDSGVGGLTVVRALHDALPNEPIVFIGDSARSPYGPRSVEQIQGFAVEIADALVARDVKMLVIACNSIEVTAIAEVAAAAQLPVVGVVDPGARAAVAATRSGVVGVIGTEATIASGAYERAVHAIDDAARLHTAACPSFVGHVEGGTTGDPALRAAATEYLTPLRHAGVDTLILGCTHYPLIAGLIGDVMGEDVVLVSSATETVRDVRVVLTEAGLEAEAPPAAPQFFCTGDPDLFASVADRFMGHHVDVEQIELT